MATEPKSMELVQRAFSALIPMIVVLAGLIAVGCGGSSADPTSTGETASSEPSQSVSLEDLGIALSSSQAAGPGVLVRSLAGNGPHSLLLSGDRIVTVDSEQVESVADVNRALRSVNIGDSLALTVVRGSHRLNLTEVLSPVAYLGAEVQDRKGAIVVVATQDGSPAAAAGVRAGDAIVAIDGKQTAKVADLLQALGTHSPGDEISIEVSRGPRKVELKATLTERPASNGSR